MIAAAEDAMAIQQKTQLKGPPKLVRPRMVINKKSMNLMKAVEPPAVTGKFHSFHVDANCKVSNGGVTVYTSDSDTHVGSTTMIGDGKIKTFTNLKQVISSDLAGPTPNWAEKVASQAQLKPSTPPSMRVSGRTARPTESNVDLDDELEEYSEPAPKHRGERGKKCSLLVPDKIELSTEELEDPDAAEELKILEDPEADEEPENLKTWMLLKTSRCLRMES
ncbi:hypothetical protein BDR07DRAFT_1376315 [Suillus spraguei]|nr:hypothetical protein BDR07DRAFT_1376315 [Suillus spraguei]